MTAFWDIISIALMMEAVRTSETSTSTRLHNTVSQKAAIFKNTLLCSVVCPSTNFEKINQVSVLTIDIDSFVLDAFVGVNVFV
jgi:hypothetical protein